MDTTRRPGEFSESQRAGLEVRQADQDRTLAGMHHLEAMLAAAAPGAIGLRSALSLAMKIVLAV